MNTSPVHLLNETFLCAVQDYLFLIGKGYPQKPILKMTGDRYALSGIQRIMLFRGISTQETSRNRIPKQVSEAGLAGQVIHIDALNVLITVGTYLSGGTVFISMDHFLRDAAGVHGRMIRKDLLHKALTLSLEYLVTLNLKEIVFYVDEQVNDSGTIHDLISQQVSHLDIPCSVQICDQVDSTLSGILTGIIATSDSTIIDRSVVPVFDLAFQTIKHNFQPNFIDLRSLSL
ncbi:MAG: DUF434 domain-containing protein [Lentimicrobiaceae bacterium]|nr:DUF434 domain-containing protein [Lentimicrobiaceae bacterium]